MRWRHHAAPLNVVSISWIFEVVEDPSDLDLDQAIG